jgi:two-component system, OmpR family, phosphate regulon response regulator OmpR
MSDNPHLLVVDDDSRIRTLLSRYLSERGFRVSTAASAAEARAQMSGLDFDLMVLDVMMPGESGLELARSIRGSSRMPILMLTARAEPGDRIAGLEIGVDDYLAKPFEPKELVLRIGNILRRAEPAPAVPQRTEIAFGPFRFDLKQGDLSRDGKLIRITDRERELLRTLATRAGEAVPRADLIGPQAAPGDRAVDVLVTRLRRKIEEDLTNPIYLRTVRGMGYLLAAEA